MSKTKIEDNFCGYLKVGDDLCAYHVSNDIVTLLPAENNGRKRHEIFERILSRSEGSSEYLFDEDNEYIIAMLHKGSFSDDVLGLNTSIQFSTPVIVKACGNADGFFGEMTEAWEKFHAITFYGGNINALYNPQAAVKQPDIEEYLKCNGAREIKMRPYGEYTRSVDFKVDGEKVTFTVSVLSAGKDNSTESKGEYSLGTLNSCIRFSFETAQDFDKIEKYYKIARRMVAILTSQNNVSFDVYISQRTLEGKYIKTGICKIFDPYANYSVRAFHRVMPIWDIFDYIPTLINAIVHGDADPLLELLPKDNKYVGRVSIVNVQDACAALEDAYRKGGKRTREKDNLIEELKEKIKKTIAEFLESYAEIDVHKETNIKSAFDYLDFTLKQKILTLYNENSKVVDEIVSKWSLPQVNEESLTPFVRLRNGKAHSGTMEWGDSARLYTAMFALVYACFFRTLGLSDEMIISMLLQVF